MILSLRNRQKRRGIHAPHLRLLTVAALRQLRVPDWEIGIHLVGSDEMARVNLAYLGHEGSTDVITFDHRQDPNVPGRPLRPLHGELYVCLDDAILQAREHGATWMSEVTRYVVHGLLHLCGHDDLQTSSRRMMKRMENRMVEQLETDYGTRKLARSAVRAAGRVPRKVRVRRKG